MTIFAQIYNFKELEKRLVKPLRSFHYMPVGQFLSKVNNNQDSITASMDVILPIVIYSLGHSSPDPINIFYSKVEFLYHDHFIPISKDPLSPS